MDPPLATTIVSVVYRVFRDPAAPGYTTGMEHLFKDCQQITRENGWEGPWELTHWGRLTEEVLRTPNLQLEDLPKVTNEEGARGTNLHYRVTSLDAYRKWESKAKAKTK